MERSEKLIGTDGTTGNLLFVIYTGKECNRIFTTQRDKSGGDNVVNGELVFFFKQEALTEGLRVTASRGPGMGRAEAVWHGEQHEQLWKFQRTGAVF